MLRQAQKGEISVPDEKIKELKERAKELRKTAVTMIYEAQSGHPGGSLSAADIVAALYFSEMHVDPKDPKWPDRDRFVLSKGHVCPIQYAALGKLGFFPEEDLHTLRQEGSKLQGHPSMLKCPGIDISTGSLGQGTACAVGMALAGKRDGRDYRVFDMVGDGELDEGIIWEAMMTAHKYELDNFIMILDNNGLQLDGPSEVIMPLIDVNMKAEAFGFEVYEIDGHDMGQIVEVFDMEEYPGWTCRVVDSTNASAGFGLVVLRAADNRDKGLSLADNADELESMVHNTNSIFTTNDLTYLYRGGRVSKTAAAFGTALNIVPIMHLDYEGHLEVWQKVRGDKQCFKKVIKDVQELVVDAAGQTLIVSEADAPEKAREYGEALVRECGFRDVFYTHIGPIIGAHTGPGLISIFFVGKERA